MKFRDLKLFLAAGFATAFAMDSSVRASDLTHFWDPMKCPRYAALDCHATEELAGLNRKAGLVDTTGNLAAWEKNKLRPVFENLMLTDLREHLLQGLVQGYLDTQDLLFQGQESQAHALPDLKSLLAEACSTSKEHGFTPDDQFLDEFVKHLEKTTQTPRPPLIADYTAVAQAAQCMQSIDRRIRDTRAILGPEKMRTVNQVDGADLSFLIGVHIAFDPQIAREEMKKEFLAPCGYGNYGPATKDLCDANWAEHQDLLAEQIAIQSRFPYLGDFLDGELLYKKIASAIAPISSQTLEEDARYQEATRYARIPRGLQQIKSMDEIAAITQGARCMDLRRPPAQAQIQAAKRLLMTALMDKKRHIAESIRLVCDKTKGTEYARGNVMLDVLMTGFFSCTPFDRSRKSSGESGSVCEHRKRTQFTACGLHTLGERDQYLAKLGSQAIDGTVKGLELWSMGSFPAGFVGAGEDILAGAGAQVLKAFTAGAVAGTAVDLAQKGLASLTQADAKDQLAFTLSNYELGHASPEEVAQARAALVAQEEQQHTNILKTALVAGLYSLSGYGPSKTPKIKISEELVPKLENALLQQIKRVADQIEAHPTQALKDELKRYQRMYANMGKELEIVKVPVHPSSEPNPREFAQNYFNRRTKATPKEWSAELTKQRASGRYDLITELVGLRIGNPDGGLEPVENWIKTQGIHDPKVDRAILEAFKEHPEAASLKELEPLHLDFKNLEVAGAFKELYSGRAGFGNLDSAFLDDALKSSRQGGGGKIKTDVLVQLAKASPKDERVIELLYRDARANGKHLGNAPAEVSDALHSADPGTFRNARFNFLRGLNYSTESSAFKSNFANCSEVIEALEKYRKDPSALLLYADLFKKSESLFIGYRKSLVPAARDRLDHLLFGTLKNSPSTARQLVESGQLDLVSRIISNGVEHGSEQARQSIQQITGSDHDLLVRLHSGLQQLPPPDRNSDAIEAVGQLTSRWRALEVD